MCVQGGGTRHFIVTLRKQVFQTGVFFRPVFLFWVKCIRKPAPSNIAGEGFLFFWSSIAVLLLKAEEEFDGCYIAAELFLWTAFPEVVVGDAEVLGGDAAIGSRMIRFVSKCFLLFRTPGNCLRSTLAEALR